MPTYIFCRVEKKSIRVQEEASSSVDETINEESDQETSEQVVTEIQNEDESENENSTEEEEQDERDQEESCKYISLFFSYFLLMMSQRRIQVVTPRTALT